MLTEWDKALINHGEVETKHKPRVYLCKLKVRPDREETVLALLTIGKPTDPDATLCIPTKKLGEMNEGGLHVPADILCKITERNQREGRTINQWFKNIEETTGKAGEPHFFGEGNIVVTWHKEGGGIGFMGPQVEISFTDAGKRTQPPEELTKELLSLIGKKILPLIFDNPSATIEPSPSNSL